MTKLGSKWAPSEVAAVADFRADGKISKQQPLRCRWPVGTTGTLVQMGLKTLKKGYWGLRLPPFFRMV
jgi:hypothetical protein